MRHYVRIHKLPDSLSVTDQTQLLNKVCVTTELKCKGPPGTQSVPAPLTEQQRSSASSNENVIEDSHSDKQCDLLVLIPFLSPSKKQ